MAEALRERGAALDDIFARLAAADRVASAAMWLVVHETYARRVRLDGRPLEPDEFKAKPEGHTGGSLNMVPAYAGYMAVDAVTDLTRGWIMGQGHCVSAVDSVNLLLGNMTPEHAARYSVTDEGLTRYVRDFYSYRLRPGGVPDSPLGSHVNAHTAGGLAEGGYLGFVELQYVHMPLPGERLVAFLSDGAFEEQRGSDWAPRWWRADDSGLVAPMMIKNGRRIDQRTIAQEGGTEWFVDHLRLNGFDPIVFDGRDPAAFAWAIWECERRLEERGAEARSGKRRYPVPLPYGVAVAPKGAGFCGEGTNRAHNLPLPGSPREDRESARQFNEGAARLHVPPDELRAAIETLTRPGRNDRPRERDHPLARRDVRLASIPAIETLPVDRDRRASREGPRRSPMMAIDQAFLAIVRANPRVRPRVGNPDEMRSNRLDRTLEALKFRATDPEPDLPEDVHGAIVTALNEEAIACAALGNKGGINLVHTYEAFGARMQGILRQEVLFAERLRDAGRPPGWLSVPVVLTSHTWENSKNELSHQDPSLAETMSSEHSDVARVVYVPDFNSAATALARLYGTRGQAWVLVVPKGEVPVVLDAAEAGRLVDQGGLRLEWAGHEASRASLVLTAIGAYQLEQVLQASARLAERGVSHSVVCLFEPGRFRMPRTKGEEEHLAPATVREALYPEGTARLFVAHTRPESILGLLAPLHAGPGRTAALGFLGLGGTLTTAGMLFVNRCTWAHVLQESARLLGRSRESLLTVQEIDVLDGRLSPEGLGIV